MNYQEKLEQLYKRKHPLHTFSSSAISNWPDGNDALQYICAAMSEVEKNYRKNTIEAAKKVHQHLREINCDFELQGSVPTKTEIKHNSDIDLVIITKIAKRLGNGVPRHSPYSGNLTSDLKQLREYCETKLNGIYNEVNTSKAKSIEVYLTNPRRKVDVIIANWYDSLKFYKTYSTEYRGINLYDKNKNKRTGPDFPFLRIHNINNHDYSAQVKKIVRFLKNIREDFYIQNLTSFEINCIAFNFPYNYRSSNNEVDILKILWHFLPEQGTKTISSPCGKEKVEIQHNAKLNNVIDQLIADAK